MRMALMSASTVAPLKYDSSPTSPDTRGRTLIGFAQVLGRQPPPNRANPPGAAPSPSASLALLRVDTGPDPATRRRS